MNDITRLEFTILDAFYQESYEYVHGNRARTGGYMTVHTLTRQFLDETDQGLVTAVEALARNRLIEPDRAALSEVVTDYRAASEGEGEGESMSIDRSAK